MGRRDAAVVSVVEVDGDQSVVAVAVAGVGGGGTRQAAGVEAAVLLAPVGTDTAADGARTAGIELHVEDLRGRERGADVRRGAQTGHP